MVSIFHSKGSRGGLKVEMTILCYTQIFFFPISDSWPPWSETLAASYFFNYFFLLRFEQNQTWTNKQPFILSAVLTHTCTDAHTRAHTATVSGQGVKTTASNQRFRED